MEYLYLRYGMEICLRSKVTQKYLAYNEQSNTTNATSMPPYIQIAGIESKTDRKLPSLKLRILPKDDKDHGAIVTFGSRILLIDCETKWYLTAVASKSTIGLDKPSLHEAGNEMLEKTATFIVMDDKNIRSKQPITVYDEVHLKSVMGTYLLCEPSGDVNLKGQSARAQTAWHLMKADTPFIPAWVYQRPTFSKFIAPQQSQADVSAPRDTRQQLGFQSASVQEIKLVEDILDVMLSFDGEFIRRNSQGLLSIEPQRERPTCNSALAEQTAKILTLPTYYCIIENYISTYSIQQGTVCQALCCGLRKVVREYKMMVTVFDEEVDKRGLTLQEIWYYIQPSLQLMESIVALLKEVQNKKGGMLISCILNMLKGNSSEQVAHIYRFLFDNCIRVYIQMISKWIYEGVVEDKFQEFMIKELDKDSDKLENYWEEKYEIRREQIPNIFEKDAHLILVTGKYLNIIKACEGLEEHPLHKQIEKNIDKHIKNQDFTESILRAYDWANQKLQTLVLKEYKLQQVLKSVKGYYFLGFGDLFVHFMDSAEDDLNAKSLKFSVDAKAKPISVQKLQNLFELLIRTSSANNDPYKEDISCKLQQKSLYEQVQRIKNIEYGKLPMDNSKQFVKKQSRNVDYFSLDFKCKFPLNLIVNKQNMNKYQTIFRFLFWCKFLERQLNGIWLDLQGTKIANVKCFKKANLLTQKMLNFIKGLIYYLSYEVVEKNWRIFEVNLTKIKNFEDIISFHNQFLLRCLSESMLLNSKLLNTITDSLGNSCQAFLLVKKYVGIFDPLRMKTATDPKRPSQNQKIERRKQIEQYFEQWVEEGEFDQMVHSLNEDFETNMKKLLRQINSIIGVEGNSHLASLLDTLDPQRFYNRLLFEEGRGLSYF